MNYYENNLKIELFGESHGSEVGVTVYGLPQGFVPDMDYVQDMLDRRKAGAFGTTARVEEDRPQIESGLSESGAVCGPVRAVFPNRNTDSTPYRAPIPRPGHGDYPYFAKTGRFVPGGATSARKTVGLVFAGALCKQYLAERGVYISAQLKKIGNIDASDKESVKKYLSRLMAEGDSCGGVIECTIHGLPAGFGPVNESKLEARIASCVFGLPAVKGLEFGAGFAAARMQGSENNDPFYPDGDKLRTRTNNAGGVLGGMASGMPVVFSAAFKPTPSIAKEQDSVNVETWEAVKLKLSGRHDTCVALRAPVIVESAAAIAIADTFLEQD